MTDYIVWSSKGRDGRKQDFLSRAGKVKGWVASIARNLYWAKYFVNIVGENMIKIENMNMQHATQDKRLHVFLLLEKAVAVSLNLEILRVFKCTVGQEW